MLACRFSPLPNEQLARADLNDDEEEDDNDDNIHNNNNDDEKNIFQTLNNLTKRGLHCIIS